MSILSENFPFDSIVKQKKITPIDWALLDSNNNLLLQGASPGDFLIIDDNNKVVNVPQSYHQKGVLLHFSESIFVNSSSSSDSSNDLNNWKIMYINNYPCIVTNQTFQELIKLSLIFN